MLKNANVKKTNKEKPKTMHSNYLLLTRIESFWQG